MGTVTIIISDNEDGCVGVVSDPDAKEIADMIREMVKTKKTAPGSITYAMRALTAMLSKSTQLRSEQISAKKISPKK